METSKNIFAKVVIGSVVVAGMAIPSMSQTKPSPNEIRSAVTPMQVQVKSRLVSGQKAAIFVNGRAINFGGEKLLQSKGQIYAPLKPLIQVANFTVTNDLTTREITIQWGNRLVRVSQPSPTQNPIVPLRFVAEKLGGTMRVVAGSSRNGGITEIYITLSGQQGSGTINTVRSEPPRQGQAISVSEAVQYNLDALNAYRAKAGVPALKLDAKLNEFALKGSQVLLENHKPHHHFSTSDIWSSGFIGGAAENQGDPNGWTIRGNLNTTIDDILKAMFDEGPGGGHHDNMLNRDFRRVGIGLVVSGDQLYLTNDFSK